MVRKTGTNLCIDIHCISKVQIYILILILETKNKILKIGKMRNDTKEGRKVETLYQSIIFE